MNFEIKKRNIFCCGKSVIGDNSDYIANFIFDSEWDYKIKTARFQRTNGEYADVILENDSCEIPVEVLKFGYLSVGVFTDEMTTTYCNIFVKESIKEKNGNPLEPTPDVYSQIIEMLEDLQVNGVTDAQIEKAIKEYLEENPITGVDEEEVQKIVSEYIEANKDSLKGADGKDGTNGVDGKSAYEIALEHGFEGSEEEWLASLKGEDGADGKDGTNGSADISDEQISEAVNAYMEENPVTRAEDQLHGKKIICVGDSICEGVGANNQPYAYWLQQWHPNTEVINLGVGGMTIAQKDATITNSMPVRIASGEFEGYTDVDVVVFEGGINDLMNNVKLGYISKGYSVANYKTFCQGMEYMFSYFKGLYPKARMIFLSTHCVTSYDYNKAQAWWGATSEICAKWGVEFLDLFSLICTPKVDGLQLHPDYAVHRDYYAKYLNMVLISEAPLTGVRTSHYYKHNVPIMLAYYSGTKQFNVGDTVSTSDWRINMVRGDLTTYVNVSSNVTYDLSDVDNNTEGIYPVHIAYTEDGITLSTDVDVTIVEGESATKTLDSISATKTKTSFSVGDTVNTDDITVTASYSDGSTSDVTSEAIIDTSNANMTTAGEYNIAISYTEDGVTKTTQIQISVTEVPSDGGDEEETAWDDTATVTRAWGTNEGVFSNTVATGKYTADTTYNVSCKLTVESDSVTSGEIILRLGSVNANLGSVAFGEVIEVNEQVKANTAFAVGNWNPSVYTTSGSGFPWTVHIKDFVITEQ